MARGHMKDIPDDIDFPLSPSLKSKLNGKRLA